jgi:hypothetical protein
MKLKALLLVLAVAGLAASFGLTATGRSDTGTTTGTTTTTTTTATTTTTTTGDCRPFWLSGSFASISTGSFTITPIQGRRLKAPAGPAVVVAITPDTRVLWQGKGTLAGPGVGDLARVYGKQCGSTLTAWAVRVRLAKGSEDGGNHDLGEQKQGSDGQPNATEGHSRPKR